MRSFEYSQNIIFSVVFLGAVCTALAFLLYFRLMAKLGPTKTILVTFLIPIFAVIWGKLFLGEEITMKMLAGAMLVLWGIWQMNVVKSKKVSA